MPARKLGGQAVIVTGGGGGIGRAICQALATEGAVVAVADCSADQLEETVNLIRQAEGHARGYHVDVTDQPSVQQMVDSVEQELGPVELLVNNAGIPGTCGPSWEVDPNAWWHCLDVNLRGAFLGSRAVLPYMIARRKGCIINMSSGTALGPWPNVSAYAVSKAALTRFSENLAIETREFNIAVFAADPGLVRTPMAEVVSSPEWRKWDSLIPQLLAAQKYEVPPERVAQHVLLLASGTADALSGRHLSVYQKLNELVHRAPIIQRDELYTLRLKTYQPARPPLPTRRIRRLFRRLAGILRHKTAKESKPT